MWCANIVNSMSEQTGKRSDDDRNVRTIDIVQAGLAKRYARERRYRRIGLGAISAGLLFVSFLFVSIFSNGYSAFWQTYVQLEIRQNNPGATSWPA